MQQTIHAIALRTIKYSDSKSILSAWSPELGAVSLLMPAGAGNESRRRRALTQALSLFECVIDLRTDRELYHVKDLRPLIAFNSLHSNGMKTTVAFFLAEVLAKTLQGGPDQNIWQFIVNELTDFDSMNMRHAANFHLYFLIKLSSLLGFGVDSASWQPGSTFDFATGGFMQAPPLKGRYLCNDDARIAHIFIDCECRRLSLLRLNHRLRGEILDNILAYYADHECKLTPLHTL